MDYNKFSLAWHKAKKGKLEIATKFKLKSRDDLSILYTPGVAEPCRKIFQNKDDVYKYTIKGNTVAVISDGSAVLGLGNIGAEAALPVMEGKALLFKELAGIDAFPICLNEQNIDKTVETIKNIAPAFGGINLEDFKAPECFEIERRLQNIGIPVMHDDQHGTAVVVLAGLINSLKLKKAKINEVRVVISGAGAAGMAVAKMLIKYGFKKIILGDSQGLIYSGRKGLNASKKEIAKATNLLKVKGGLKEALAGADIFIGVSKPNLVTAEMVKLMNDAPIIFALANPVPEIMPNEALKAGAFIAASGRSDFPNQINNVLAFPGIFKGALSVRAARITDKMKINAAEALAGMVKPTKEKILPNPLDRKVAKIVAMAVARVAFK